jgi:NADH-quinone oxidoreductase subunit N
VLNSVLSVYYYFRLIVIMYMSEPFEGQPDPDPITLPVAAIVAIGVLGILWLGVAPAMILNLAANSTLP